MVGKTLDYEAKRILNEGIKQGMAQGMELGASRVLTLLRKLNADHKYELADRLMDGQITAEDLQSLYKQYEIL